MPKEKKIENRYQLLKRTSRVSEYSGHFDYPLYIIYVRRAKFKLDLKMHWKS